ncbi:MAG: hypothetical protein RLZZ511_4467 [Cyanobacteriota bacterium]|jgi:hypothetical protein
MMGTTTRITSAIPSTAVMTRRILIHENATIDILEHFSYRDFEPLLRGL